MQEYNKFFEEQWSKLESKAQIRKVDVLSCVKSILSIIVGKILNHCYAELATIRRRVTGWIYGSTNHLMSIIRRCGKFCAIQKSNHKFLPRFVMIGYREDTSQHISKYILIKELHLFRISWRDTLCSMRRYNKIYILENYMSILTCFGLR